MRVVIFTLTGNATTVDFDTDSATVADVKEYIFTLWQIPILGQVLVNRGLMMIPDSRSLASFDATGRQILAVVLYFSYEQYNSDRTTEPPETPAVVHDTAVADGDAAAREVFEDIPEFVNTTSPPLTEREVLEINAPNSAAPSTRIRITNDLASERAFDSSFAGMELRAMRRQRRQRVRIQSPPPRIPSPPPRIQSPTRMSRESIQNLTRMQMESIQNPSRMSRESIQNPTRMQMESIQNPSRMSRESIQNPTRMQMESIQNPIRNSMDSTMRQPLLLPANPNPELLSQLQAMGFHIDDCHQALSEYGNDVDQALNWLLQPPTAGDDDEREVDDLFNSQSQSDEDELMEIEEEGFD